MCFHTSTSIFTELFLTRSFNHPRLLFTFRTDDSDKLLFFSAPQNKDAKNSSLVVVATRYQTRSSSGLKIISSLHGLVCCEDKRGYYTTPVICNPATGEFLTLPVLKSGFYSPGIFCGYDPTDKKFKVLSIIANENTSQARVLTLESTGKLLWRMIECKYHWPVHTPAQMICIEGVFYYLATIGDDKYVIVCFDVKSDKFSFISISIDDICIIGSTLINYKGRLGAVQFTDHDERSLRLWLLEEDADAGINKWSSSVHELPVPGNKPYINRFQIVGMTRTCDIVLCPWNLSTLFIVSTTMSRESLWQELRYKGCKGWSVIVL